MNKVRIQTKFVIICAGISVIRGSDFALKNAACFQQTALNI